MESFTLAVTQRTSNVKNIAWLSNLLLPKYIKMDHFRKDPLHGENFQLPLGEGMDVFWNAPIALIRLITKSNITFCFTCFIDQLLKMKMK